MWILPKSLISRFAPGTAALTSDSSECSRACAQSLMRRSKPSQSKSYLREWKAGSLTRLRSGAISSPSLGSSFLGWWTSSLEATHVSPSAQPASVSAQTTSGTCGPTLQTAFDFFAPESASSRTSRDTSRWDSPQSLATWRSWVTERRGAYSQRLKSARLTSESACSSWPTVTANEDSYQIGGNSQQSKCLSAMARRGEMSGPAVPENPSTHGSRPESWSTPQCHDAVGRSNNQKAIHGSKHGCRCLVQDVKAWATLEGMDGGKISRGGKRKNELLLTGQVKAWASPHANRHTGAGQAPEKQGAPNLQTQVQSWATPSSSMTAGRSEQMNCRAGREGYGHTGNQLLRQTGNNGKLNPRWVETLMGLPVGWTMPSCASPVTIAPTNCACSATE